MRSRDMDARLACAKCGEGGFHTRTQYLPAEPARPARFFGLLPATPAYPEQMRCWCPWCDHKWTVTLAALHPAPRPATHEAPRG